MKTKIKLPCTAEAATLLIGNHGYSGFGTYIKLLQIIQKLPDQVLPKEKFDHVVSTYGMEPFTAQQILDTPSLFLQDETRWIPAEEKVIHRSKENVDKQEIPIEHDLQRYVKNFFPRVSSLPKQLSVENCEKLIQEYHKELIAEKLLAMENYKMLLKKYENVYLTLNNWCRMAMNDGWEPKKKTG